MPRSPAGISVSNGIGSLAKRVCHDAPLRGNQKRTEDILRGLSELLMTWAINCRGCTSPSFDKNVIADIHRSGETIEMSFYQDHLLQLRNDYQLPSATISRSMSKC